MFVFVCVCVCLLQARLTTLASINPPMINDEEVTKDQPRPLRHGDLMRVGERTFRWTYPEGSPLEVPAAGGEQPPTPSRRRSSSGGAARLRPSSSGEKENDPGSGDAVSTPAPDATEGNGYLWLGLGVVTMAAAALVAVCARRPQGLVIRLDRA